MIQIPREVTESAEKCLQSDDGKMLVGWLVKHYGLMERTYVPDNHGKVSPINAAIRDGERGVVGVLFKLSQGEAIYPTNEDEQKQRKTNTKR